MLLTITSTTAPAINLGFLLHKNPTRIQEFELNYGKAYVFYSEATPETPMPVQTGSSATHHNRRIELKD